MKVISELFDGHIDLSSLRVGLVGSELGGLIPLVISLEGVTDGLDAAVRVGAGLDSSNITVVGVDTGNELAVLSNNIADVYSALVLCRAVTAGAVELAKVLDAVGVDVDSS